MHHFAVRTWRYLVALLLPLVIAAPAHAGRVVFARDLALSPDGATLLFSWAGDIWSVPGTGGAATRLTVHPADDRFPVWSRDGGLIAFASWRHGDGDIFVMRPDGSELRRLTFDDASATPTDFSADGQWVYFHARREGDVYAEDRIYRVPVAGGEAWRALDCFGASARLSPDGEQLAFTRGGLPWVRWSRRNYRGSGASEIWIARTDGSAFAQLTDFDGTDRLPVWSADGLGVYFLSDRSGPVNVWYQALAGGPAEQVTQMTGDDVREFAVSADGRTLAFTHWECVYVLATTDRRARAIEITAPDDAVENDIELKTFTNSADEQEPAPDGEEIAVVVRGEVFVLKTKPDKPTRRVTESPARDRDVVWSPDGKALFFVSDAAGQEDIYRATSAEEPPKALSDSLRFKIERVTDDPRLEYAPQVSPDGEKLAFVRDLGDLIIRDLKTGIERCLVESWNAPSYQWSPDSKWVVYEIGDTEDNSDVWVVPADGSAPPVNISQHPDYDGNPQWSADGRIIAFVSRRQGFDSDLYLVCLSPELDELSGVQRDEYFEQQSEQVKKRKPLKSAVASGEIVLGTPPATQPTESQPVETQPAETQPVETQSVETQPAETQPAPEADDFAARVRKLIQEVLAERDKKPKKPEKEPEDKDEAKPAKDEKKYAYDLASCYRRIRRVTSLPGDQAGLALAPDGQLLVFSSSHEGSSQVYAIKWNGEDVKRIISGGAGALRWGLDGKRLFYLKGGVPNSCTAAGSDAKAHGFRAKMAISRSAEAAQKFDDGARQLGLRFYHPTMKGLDWPALTRKYRTLALQTTTLTEFNEVFNMLLGELNASHLGIYGPGSGGRERNGYLGCRFDSDFPGPGLRVAWVLPESPADRKESRLVPGDIILRVAGQPVGPDRSAEAVLIDTVGDEVILEYVPAPQRAADSQPAATQPTDSQPADTQPASQPTPAELIIRPTSFGHVTNLMYQDWVRSNLAYVTEQSGGRVGYLHIRGMGQAEFEIFERDLYAAAHGRDALIIDVRSNGGGWTADWVLAVLNVQRHAYTITRGGAPGYPQDRLIFYAWSKPAVMMCNQQSFSNAEIISHAFKNLGRGPLVGMTTYGGVISTGGYRLIDGALVRMPGRGWYTLPDGIDMENHGAEPDVKVPIRPEDEIHGRRPQLDAALKAALDEIKRAAQQP